MQDLEDLLPELIRRKQKLVLDKVNYANSRLGKNITKVSEFVSLLEFLDEISNVRDELEDQFEVGK